jgi:hypothetical protein
MVKVNFQADPFFFFFDWPRQIDNHYVIIGNLEDAVIHNHRSMHTY